MNIELLALGGACVLSVLIVCRSFMPLHGKMPLQTITDHSSNNPTIQTTKKSHWGSVSSTLWRTKHLCRHPAIHHSLNCEDWTAKSVWREKERLAECLFGTRKTSTSLSIQFSIFSKCGLLCGASLCYNVYVLYFPPRVTNGEEYVGARCKENERCGEKAAERVETVKKDLKNILELNCCSNM